MFRNHFIVATRNLRRNPVYSLLNLAGLSIAVAVLALVGPFVSQELSYDRDHPDARHILDEASPVDLLPLRRSGSLHSRATLASS